MAELNPFERAAAMFERPKDLDLEGISRRLDPRTVWTPALQLIADELELLLNTPDGRLLISMPPQEGKTSLAAKAFPLAVLRRNPDTRIVIGSYGHTLARRSSGAVRDAVNDHPELGLKLRADMSAKEDWQLSGFKGGMFAAGVGTSLTGKPTELVLIDDPHKDAAEADSETMRENVWDWWQTTVTSRFAAGTQVCIIGTRWHEDDLIGRLIAQDDEKRWRVINIPAIADHDPVKGESDILGREPGEFMTSARGRSLKQWEIRKKEAGSRGWEALYQGRPSPAEGGMFKRAWWARYDYPLWIEHQSGYHEVLGAGFELCQSWDLAFKDTDGSDFVVGQVWMRRGAHMFLLDQVRGRMSFTDTRHAILAMWSKWRQTGAVYIEDKANGPAVINALYGVIPGLIPVMPEGSKQARAAAVTPYVEAKNVWLPTYELAPWVDDLIEECASFPRGKHDDQVDALSQAINRMLLSPYSAGDIVDPFEDYSGASISLY